METDAFDVIVVGARCAGAPLAMLLARKGRRVLLLDQAEFPADKTSTHLLKRAGLACLKRWGVLERVIQAGAPKIQEWRYHYEGIRIAAPFNPVAGVDYELATRRLQLDQILIEAAVEAGAEFRQGFTVTELLREDGRVVGVQGLHAGARVEVRAQVVVGADGLASIVAEKAGARKRLEEPAYNCGYYAYVENLDAEPALETHILKRRQLLICFPTNDDLHVVFLFWPKEMAREVRADLANGFEQTLALAPALYAKVGRGRRVSNFLGLPRFENFLREASGPGWALAGDAAQHRDPVTAYGMTQALIDADLLAAAINRGLGAPSTLDRELAGYEARRWEVHEPSFRATVKAAQLTPLHPEGEAELRRISAAGPLQQHAFIARLDREIDRVFQHIDQEA